MTISTADPPSVAAHRAELRRWLLRRPDLPASIQHEPADIETALTEEQGLQRSLWDEGFGRWGWPVAYGGLGGKAVLRAVTYEELALAGYRVPQSSYTAETLCPALIRYAPDLARELLPEALCGKEIWCQGFSEPEAGSDLAALRCRAEEVDGRWMLSGQKVWTSFGHVSQRAAVLARTGAHRHRGISMFLVDLVGDTAEVRPIRASGGRNEFSEMFFDNHPVSHARLVGGVGQGWEVAMYLLQWERGMYAWQRQAVLRARIGALVARLAGDGALGKAEAALARAWAAVVALRERAGSTVRSLSAGKNPGPAISIDKILLSRAEQAVMDVYRIAEPLRFSHGTDTTAELTRSEWFYSRAATIYGGSLDIQRTIVAENLLGLPRSGS